LLFPLPVLQLPFSNFLPSAFLSTSSGFSLLLKVSLQRALLENQGPTNKEMMSIQSWIPRVKKEGHLLPVLPLIPYKNSNVDEEKGRYIAFELKTRVGKPSDATKYKKFVRKFEEGSSQEWIDMLKDL
jgi:hypothetical protein